MSELSTSLETAFDTATEEGSSDFSPVPAGTYTAFIKKAEVETLKSGKGQAVRVQWEIEDGEYQGRIVFDTPIGFNLNCPNIFRPTTRATPSLPKRQALMDVI